MDGVIAGDRETVTSENVTGGVRDSVTRSVGVGGAVPSSDNVPNDDVRLSISDSVYVKVCDKDTTCVAERVSPVVSVRVRVRFDAVTLSVSVT